MIISVITVNLNNKEGLEKTIASVISQKLDCVEYIIVDGGSTDGSLEIINENAHEITTWISENDTGIYNAMNKGIKIATGDYLIFLNSGDTFTSHNILEEVSAFFQDVDLVYGNLNIQDNERNWVKTFPDKLDFAYFLHNYLPHPATFIKKSLFNKIGFYNESYKVISDWEFFNLAINKFNCSYKHIPLVISNFELNGISSNKTYSQIIQDEITDSLELNFPTILPAFKELFKLREEKSLLQQKYYALQNSRLVKLNQKLKNLLSRINRDNS
jgi:glycosyltransferase involved in cell wall biosynthesis